MRGLATLVTLALVCGVCRPDQTQANKMRGLATLVTLALVCGVCRTDHHHSKHFETVFSWSGIDYVFQDDVEKNHFIQNHTFIPGNAIPWGVDVDHNGRTFLAFVKIMPGIPASLGTVSEATNDKGEHLVQPYPDWSWHHKGCDGITSVEKFAILVFDLKTDQLIKQHKFQEDFVDNESAFSTIVVEVMSSDNHCEDSFAYVADAGNYAIIVYDFHHDESWLTSANEMYPHPEFGHFHVKGVDFDHMYGVYSMTLNPKTSAERSLYFNSMASGKEHHVALSVLKNKKNFEHYNHVPTEFKTLPHPRPGGQTGSETMDEHGIMFFNSINQMKVYCWNHKTDFTSDHIVEVDSDEDAFQIFADMKVVKKDGHEFLYILTNSYQKYLFGKPEGDEVHFRVMKAPIDSLVEGTACKVDGTS